MPARIARVALITLILLALAKCAHASRAQTGSGSDGSVWVMVENRTLERYTIRVSPDARRVGYVNGLSRACIRIRGAGTDDIVLIADPLASSRNVFSPPLETHHSWRWVINIARVNYAPGAWVEEPCAKRT